MAFTGQLYQLRSKEKRNVGSYFCIDGPWDKHGEVLKSEPLPNGEFLNLVRGVKEQKDKT